MLFAALVVEQRPVLREIGDERDVDSPAGPGGGGRGLQHVQRDPRVAVRVSRQAGQRLVVGADRERAEPALPILERPPHDRHDLRGAERLQHVDLRSREERRVHFERRVLGRRADEDDVARFDAREERVLLRLVEAVDLVDEEDRPAAQAPPRFLRFRHDRANLLDAGEHRAERDEVGARDVRDQARERRLAGAGRAPEDDRLQAILLDRAAQRTPRADERLLPDELVQGPRPHPLRERSRGARRRDGSRLLVK